MNFSKKLLLAIILSTFICCSRNPLKVDISNIDKTVNIVRFENALFDLKLIGDTLEAIKQLRNEYPQFFDIFTQHVIGIGDIEDDYFSTLTGKFITDTLIMEVREDVKKRFAKFDKIESELIKAFKYYNYHFPEKPLPTIYTMISGFNQSIITDEELIGIGLDKYLGSDYHYYSQLSSAPSYKVQNMHPNKIVSDVVYGWALTEFDDKGESTNLLDNMIYEGKLMYFTDALLPDVNDTLKIGYSTRQLNWCKENEANMWSHLIENKILYSNKRMDIIRFINDGPYTTSFTQDSPARTGIWIGWQIVRQYMKSNKDISLDSLMRNSDHQQILNEARYFPR